MHPALEVKHGSRKFHVAQNNTHPVPTMSSSKDAAQPSQPPLVLLAAAAVAEKRASEAKEAAAKGQSEPSSPEKVDLSFDGKTETKTDAKSEARVGETRQERVRSDTLDGDDDTGDGKKRKPQNKPIDSQHPEVTVFSIAPDAVPLLCLHEFQFSGANTISCFAV